MMPAEITRAIDSLLSKYGRDTKVIPASSLWLELGFQKANWRAVDRGLQAVGGGVLGTDYAPGWIKEHAAEIAEAITEEMTNDGA